MMAFDAMDTHKRGHLSQIDVIKGLRTNSRVRELLDLPSKIKQEDGSRDQFEHIFHEMDNKNDKTVDLEHFFYVTAKLAGGVEADETAAGGETEAPGDGTRTAIESGGVLMIDDKMLEIENGKILEIENGQFLEIENGGAA